MNTKAKRNIGAKPIRARGLTGRRAASQVISSRFSGSDNLDRAAKCSRLSEPYGAILEQHPNTQQMTLPHSYSHARSVRGERQPPYTNKHNYQFIARGDGQKNFTNQRLWGVSRTPTAMSKHCACGVIPRNSPNALEGSRISCKDIFIICS